MFGAISGAISRAVRLMLGAISGAISRAVHLMLGAISRAVHLMLGAKGEVLSRAVHRVKGEIEYFSSRAYRTRNNIQCTQSLTQSLTHSPTHSLPPSLTPSLPQSLPHSLTHSSVWQLPLLFTPHSTNPKKSAAGKPFFLFMGSYLGCTTLYTPDFTPFALTMSCCPQMQ